MEAFPRLRGQLRDGARPPSHIWRLKRNFGLCPCSGGSFYQVPSWSRYFFKHFVSSMRSAELLWSNLQRIRAGWVVGFKKLVSATFSPDHFLQKYLLPLILGGREDRKQLERMAASLSELSGSVAQTGKD